MYYTYYSYETNKGIDGLGYIGYRKCPNNTTPEEDKYWGTQTSPKNRDFAKNSNKEKIILSIFETQEEAIAHEIYLHKLWDVDNNPHFANQAKQTSEKFCCSAQGEDNPFFGQKHTKESRQKISEARRGKCTGENNPNYGKPLAEKTRKKISEARKGKYKGKDNPFYGKEHTEESRQKMSKANTGEKNHRYDHTIYKWKHKDKTEIVQMTQRQFINHYGLDSRSVSKVIKGKRKHHKGWSLVKDQD